MGKMESRNPGVWLMQPLPEFSEPSWYELRVNGRLSEQSALWFEGMEIAVDETLSPVQTSIQGYIADQSALHGLISRIRDLGLTLVSVNQIEEKDK